MPISLDLWDSFGGGKENEGVFSRDEDGNLIRQVAATYSQLDQKITIAIDGIEVKDIPLATVVKDAQGVIRYNLDGLPIIRRTTIYDAGTQLVREGTWTQDELDRRIPVLCHREHLKPVGVCRMCSVHVVRVRKRDGKKAPGDKLVPSCHHEIQPDMKITTRVGPDVNFKDYAAYAGYAKEVQSSVTLLAEFLLADNYHPEADAGKTKVYDNELKKVADNLELTGPRPGIPTRRKDLSHATGKNVDRHPNSRPTVPLPMSIAQTAHKVVNSLLPYSSRTVAVDHDRCIGCDRCVRACNEVRPFKVIGHTGKGYKTRISFDLDSIMAESNCVQCGECMNSCPTGALQLNKRIVPKPLRDALEIEGDSPLLAQLESPNTVIAKDIVFYATRSGKAESGFLSAEEMQELTFDFIPEFGTPKSTLSFSPFQKVPLSYLRWNEGAVRRLVVKKGHVLGLQGHYANTAYFLGEGQFGIYSRDTKAKAVETGFLGRLFGRSPREDDPNELGTKIVELGTWATILGELACMANKRRTASIRVESDTAIVYEVTRNVLDMVQRSESARDVLNLIYTRNAIRSCLQRRAKENEPPTLFQDLVEREDREALTRLLVDAPAGKDRATLRRTQPGERLVGQGERAQDFYIIRLGSVKITQDIDGREVVLNRQTEDEYFGEIAMLEEDGRRTATVTALDTVEAIRIPKSLFNEMRNLFPSVERKLQEARTRHLTRNRAPKPIESDILGDFLNQGLYQGRFLMMLDLKSCTRCDECTKACADVHGDGYSRLLREGNRFGDYLVAASCRSCNKPYCMDGCPVDAIHRSGTSLQIKIENHCIQCGLCERNCPYGSIQLPPKQTTQTLYTLPTKAINCDKCNDLVPDDTDPFCVRACPHKAAFRMTGEEVLAKVMGG